MKNGWINEELYQRIHTLMPIPSVDILPVHNKKLLLMRRNNEPGKNLWWPPGGRILVRETLEDAAKRELFEETGLKPKSLTKVNVMSHFWPQYHFITTFFKADVESDTIALNSEHSEYRWITTVDEKLHQYVKHMISESNIF